MIGLAVAGIAVAVAVTAGAAVILQARADSKAAGAFEERERYLLDISRGNKAIAESEAAARVEAETGAKTARSDYALAKSEIDAARAAERTARAQAASAHERAATAESDREAAMAIEPEEMVCEWGWDSPLPPLR